MFIPSDLIKTPNFDNETPNTYSYITATDTLDQVAAPFYFAGSDIRPSDVISVRSIDGEMTFTANGLTAMPSAAEVAAAVENNTVSRALKLMLKNAQLPITISIQGDSTGNEDAEWFVLAWSQIAAKYPAYNMLQYLWSDANQTFLPPKTKQLGANGLRYVPLTAGAGQYGTVLNSGSNFEITEDLDVRIKLKIGSIPASGERLIMARSGSPGNKCWALGMTAAGIPSLWWSEDGTAVIGPIAGTESLPIGSDLYLRCVLDVNDGSGNTALIFYTSSDDGETWDQLGDTISRSGTTSIFNGTENIIINGRSSILSQVSYDFYHAEILDGIDGPMLASPNAALYMLTAEYKNFKDAQGNSCSFSTATGDSLGSPTIVLLNCSAPGEVITYSTNATRFAKQTPMRCVLNFISYSHNDSATSNYYSNYPTLINDILTKYINAVVIPCTQNPKKSPSTAERILDHGYRCGLIAQIAASRALPLVDAYGSFISTGNSDDYIKSDGIHPTIVPENGTAISGSQLWANEVVKVLGFKL